MNDDREQRLATFKKNYTGIYDAEMYFNYLQDCHRIDKTYKNATYSESTNQRMIREAKQQAFNRHLRR